jgi:DNA-binding transcriptional regulator YiaG
VTQAYPTERVMRALALRRGLLTRPERRWLRVQFGLTQAVIARELGVSNTTVSRWESGERIPVGDNLAAYVAILARLAGEERT